MTDRMDKRKRHCESFEVNLPSGVKGFVQLRVDLAALAQDLGWKAYFNKSRRTILKNGIVEARIYDLGVASGKDQASGLSEGSGTRILEAEA